MSEGVCVYDDTTIVLTMSLYIMLADFLFLTFVLTSTSL